MERALRGLGASVRNADDIYPGGSASVFRGFALKARPFAVASRAKHVLHTRTALTPMRTWQVVALLFSRFEEVLYLDSDNVALADPTGALLERFARSASHSHADATSRFGCADLFQWGPYRDSGMLLWPDFWPPSPADDAFAVAPEARGALAAAPGANRSVESGQLLLHKRAAWRPALMTWFVNMQARSATHALWLSMCVAL
jgi:hypothetical protein